jgi:hypothetical protein
VIFRILAAAMASKIQGVVFSALVLGCLALAVVPSASGLVVKLNTLILTVPGEPQILCRIDAMMPWTP